MNHGWSKKRDTPERKACRAYELEMIKAKYDKKENLDRAIESMADGMAEHLVKK